MQNATFVNSENPGDRTKIFRLRREAENASSNLFLSHGDFRGGYYLPDPLPPFPRKVQPSQEWLTRWDEGTWGFWATVKLITPMAFHVVRNRLTTRAWRRKSWAEFRHFLQS